MEKSTHECIFPINLASGSLSNVTIVKTKERVSLTMVSSPFLDFLSVMPRGLEDGIFSCVNLATFHVYCKSEGNGLVVDNYVCV